MWKTIGAFAIGCLLLGSPAVSAGDTFRCGSDLVGVGDTMGKVVMTCGQPSWKDSVG